MTGDNDLWWDKTSCAMTHFDNPSQSPIIQQFYLSGYEWIPWPIGRSHELWDVVMVTSSLGSETNDSLSVTRGDNEWAAHWVVV